MMATTFRCTTLETSMQMQSCHLFWHKSTLSIILKRELVDCAPSREVPVLHVKRPPLLGGDLEIELGGSVHPVRMLPVSGKDVRNLRFGLVYGPKRKRVRFRAPDLATYDSWEIVLELAVEKAATERPTFPIWPYPGTSPTLSVLEDGYISEEFGFSDGDDEIKLEEVRHKALHDVHEVRRKPVGEPEDPTTGSFVDFIDPPSPSTSSADFGSESEFDRTPSTKSEYDLPVLAREVEVSRPNVLPPNNNRKVIAQHHTSLSQIVWKPRVENPFATRLRLQVISSPVPEADKVTTSNYFSWLRGEIPSHNERVKRKGVITNPHRR